MKVSEPYSMVYVEGFLHGNAAILFENNKVVTLKNVDEEFAKKIVIMLNGAYRLGVYSHDALVVHQNWQDKK